jgi:ferric-dicitrate binding protein FerR (iron transport regulator)
VGFSTHSHNLYLDVAIEQGIVALIALIWMWLLIGEAAWQAMVPGRTSKRIKRPIKSQEAPGHTDQKSSSIRRNRGTRGRPSSWRVVLGAASLSLVVMLVHGLVDDAIYNSRAILIFFIPLAFGVPVLKRVASPSRRRQLQFTGAVLLVGLLVAVIWWRPLFSLIHSNLATVRQSRAELSLYHWPEYPIQDLVRQELDTEPITAAYRRALELNPDNASANRRLGQIELSIGQYGEALVHLEKAYQTMPMNNTIRQLFGEALIVNGRISDGAALWSTVNNEQGQLKARRFWYQYIGENDHLAAIQQAELLVQTDGKY